MSTNDAARDVAERAASVLGPESGLWRTWTPQASVTHCGARSATATNPAEPARAAVQLATDLARIPVVAGAKAFGGDVEPPVEVDPKDRRFAAPAWEDNPAYYATRLAYLATCRFARDVVGSAQMDPDGARRP